MFKKKHVRSVEHDNNEVVQLLKDNKRLLEKENQRLEKENRVLKQENEVLRKENSELLKCTVNKSPI